MTAGLWVRDPDIGSGVPAWRRGDSVRIPTGYLPGWGLPDWQDEPADRLAYKAANPGLHDVDPNQWNVKDGPWFGNLPDTQRLAKDNVYVDGAGDLVIAATWRDTVYVGNDSVERWVNSGYADHRIGRVNPGAEIGTSSDETIYEQLWGRWEVCGQAVGGDNSYGALGALLWLRCVDHEGEIDSPETWGYVTTPTPDGQVPGSGVYTFHSSTNLATVNGKPYQKALWRANEELGDYSDMSWPYLSKNLPLNPAHDGFHVWALERMPDYIAGFYDGQEFFRVTPATHAWLWDADFFGSPFAMRMNLHMGKNAQYWGLPDNNNRQWTRDPLEMKVRYVRAWRYTP